MTECTTTDLLEMLESAEEVADDDDVLYHIRTAASLHQSKAVLGGDR